MYKILIVEDEVIAAEYLKSILEDKDWTVVDIVDNCNDVIKSVNKYSPDLILMDIMINGPKSGCEVAMEVRNISNCSIVFLTSYADEEMISYAMEAKADGYLVKPYNEKEIIANISLLFAKNKSINSNPSQCRLLDDFYFNHQENLLYKQKEVVKLGPRSLKIIRILCNQKDSCISYENLYQNIWDDEINLKKLQMVIYRIRETTGVDFIENIKGVGYQIKVQ